MSQPLILLTNDDGFTAKGLLSLANSVNDLGELFIVAPTHPQSGMGHAITVNEPIRFEKTNYFKSINAYNCSGTPVDCIKAGMYLLGDRKPDLVLSGINHGSNVSTNVLYSGTMSAAVEGALEGIPSIGFSLTDYSKDADFSASSVIVQSIVKEALKNKIKKGICLNVNIPNVPLEKIKGIKTCRQGKAFWDDTFDKRVDPLGKEYYWLTGSFVNHEQSSETDVFLLQNNYVTIVPVQFDMTAYDQIDNIKKWKLNL